ncbi:MAG TPA: hypothetical protein PLJ88_01040 [Agitococcus sp.]|nr:hypothetical protein [Agitococcus sp.]
MLLLKHWQQYLSASIDYVFVLLAEADMPETCVDVALSKSKQ